MNKRGQIYILVALVMSIVIFGLVSVTNRAEQEPLESNFEKLSANYAKESARLVNSLITIDGEKVGAAFNDFSLLFTSYSKTQSPDFGLIYAFKYNSVLYVGNYLKYDLTIDCDTCKESYTINGCYSEIPASVGFDGLELDVQIDQETLGGCTLEQSEFAGGDPSYIILDIEGVPYQFTLEENQPEVIMVSWETKGNQRKVFTGGELTQLGQ